MPSHIFTRLGMWDESIASNLEVGGGGSCARESRKGFDGGSNEQLHAMDYLAYAYLQTGQEAGAQRVLADLNAMQKVDQPIFTVAYAATAVPARIVLENRRWKEAASLQAAGQCREARAAGEFPMGRRAHPFRASRRRGPKRRCAGSAGGRSAKLKAIEDALVVPPGTYDWRKQVSIERQVAEAWTAYAEGRRMRPSR